MKKLFVLFLTILCTSCSTLYLPSPQSLGAIESGYTYIPIDPFSVTARPNRNCFPPESEFLDYEDENYNNISNEMNLEAFHQLERTPLLKSLPDNAVRMSIERFDASGTVNYGPAGVGLKNESYRVTVDYVNSDTAEFRVLIAKFATRLDTREVDIVDLLLPVDSRIYDPESASYDIKTDTYNSGEYAGYTEYNIPVYVGVGLRVTANIDIVGGTANISGLGVIGAEAEANNLEGSLVIQTLGINGNSIAAALPIQSELNRTTAQNAIVSVGAIKALLYDTETTKSPRLVGIYLPFPGGKALVNRIISEISKEDSVIWYRSCLVETEA